MASAENMVAVFIGTTTASNQDSAGAIFTWDLSSSPAGRTPTAVSSDSRISKTRSTTAQRSFYSVMSLSCSSNAAARQTDFSQQSPPAYHKPESTKQTPGLYISLIVLSTVIIVTALVVGWLAWHRYRQEHRNDFESSLERLYDGSSRSSPVLRKTAGRHSDTSDMTGPTLVSEQDWRATTLAYPSDSHRPIGSSKKSLALAKSSPGPASTRELGQLVQPSTPPAKQNSRLPPAVPPPCPTYPKGMDTTRHVSRYHSFTAAGGATGLSTHLTAFRKVGLRYGDVTRFAKDNGDDG